MLFANERRSENHGKEISEELQKLRLHIEDEEGFGSLRNINTSLYEIQGELQNTRTATQEYGAIVSHLQGIRSALEIQNFMNANLPLNEKPLNWSLEELERALILLDGNTSKMAALIGAKESNINDNIRKKKKEEEMKNLRRKILERKQ